MDRYEKISFFGRNSTEQVISVVIPVYNVASYLREALDSVINQTYEELEIIVVDDGSTDGSGSICDEYKLDPRVIVIHQSNGGLSTARNVGLDHATGEYISFLDPDDAWHPSFIEKLLSAITRNDVDIAVCRYTRQKTEGSLISAGKNGIRVLRGLRRSCIPQPTAKEGTYGREDSLRMIANQTLNVSVWNKLYRAKLWKSIRFPDGYNFEDNDVMCHIIDISTSVTIIDHVLYYYRIRPGSITQTMTRKNINDLKEMMIRKAEFVRSHTPEIFNERDVLKIRSSILGIMVTIYAKLSFCSEAEKEALRQEIITTGQQIGLKNCTIRRRAAYFMVKHSPWLLKYAYYVYSPLKLLVSRR